MFEKIVIRVFSTIFGDFFVLILKINSVPLTCHKTLMFLILVLFNTLQKFDFILITKFKVRIHHKIIIAVRTYLFTALFIADSYGKNFLV